MQVLFILLFSFILLGDTIQQKVESPHQDKILFVVSNADHYGNSDIVPMVVLCP